MLKHVVLIKFNPDVDDSYIAAVGEKVDALPRAIEQVRSVAYGSDVALTSGSCDFAIVIDLFKAEDYEAYAAHETHLELVELIKKGVESRTVVDFEC
ncbi:Dabb family protein [Rhodococcus globerulus]|uniref:Dabb family protein n=1 Tax=Rhodococcus globerulus TaxID=33008 RepID=A0ABU4C5P5_RHOGO|nr:Dabb family protein [Rhodococcus globerulus]MDV6271729.1 Dabb family protein [Rhodococcus globerulus]